MNNHLLVVPNDVSDDDVNNHEMQISRLLTSFV